MPLKALLARLAEQTVHPAAHLTADAERGPFLVGDVDRLDIVGGIVSCRIATVCGEEILDGTVLGMLAVDRGRQSCLKMFGKGLAVSFRDVGHLVEGAHPCWYIHWVICEAVNWGMPSSFTALFSSLSVIPNKGSFAFVHLYFAILAAKLRKVERKTKKLVSFFAEIE